MDLTHVNIVFQIIVLLFAVSLHESAHAWTAWRLGDPTAYMLGRITLNPIRHIDPVGSVVVPIITAFLGFTFGWAKPTPVNTRHFKHIVRDDILTSVAGPVSNFMAAIAAVAVLKVIALTSMLGATAVSDSVHFIFAPGQTHGFQTNSALNPLAVILCDAVFVNVILGVFNLIPIPPLDGSHVLRHMLPDAAVRIYDSLGLVGLLLLFTVGGRVIWFFAGPVLEFFFSPLMR
ncbi:MAG TPA: site-2 protease family protein [Terriglobales bacterium]|nr:site-2 protease family protein [Terriglobales bacterium]